MLRLSPMAKENEQHQQKRLTSFLCFSKSLIFFSYTSTSQGLAGVFSAAFPVWGQHKTFPNPQHTCFCLKPHQEELLYSFIVKAFIIGAICKEHFSFFFFFFFNIKKNLKLRYELPTFCGVLTSILGLTAAASSFTGSSLASAASASDCAADGPATDAPPVTSSLSFWFSNLQPSRKRKTKAFRSRIHSNGFFRAGCSYQTSFGKTLQNPWGGAVLTPRAAVNNPHISFFLKKK